MEDKTTDATVMISFRVPSEIAIDLERLETEWIEYGRKTLDVTLNKTQLMRKIIRSGINALRLELQGD